MKYATTAILVLVVLMATSPGNAEWRMRVHWAGTYTEHSIVGVDSVTFYQPLTFVPSGSFTMGDGVANCGIDERYVTLSRDFHLGLHEVTNQEYLMALQWAYDNGYVSESSGQVRDGLDGTTEVLLEMDSDCEIRFSDGEFYLYDCGHGINPDHPVKMVTWYGAARYCDWLSLQAGLPRAYMHGGDWACNQGDPYGAGGYRLPTDAEWEFAAQFDDERVYPWGNETPDCDRANLMPSAYCVGWTSSVKSYPDAPATLKLSGMAGNVQEWCNDWWTCHLGTVPVVDPTGPATGSGRVTRGGSWRSGGSALRCAHRDQEDPDFRWEGLGFRIAKTASP